MVLILQNTCQGLFLTNEIHITSNISIEYNHVLGKLTLKTLYWNVNVECQLKQVTWICHIL
jgi:hypothetical protein